MKNQFPEAMAKARQENKLVFCKLHGLRMHELSLDESQYVYQV